MYYGSSILIFKNISKIFFCLTFTYRLIPIWKIAFEWAENPLKTDKKCKYSGPALGRLSLGSHLHFVQWRQTVGSRVARSCSFLSEVLSAAYACASRTKSMRTSLIAPGYALPAGRQVEADCRGWDWVQSHLLLSHTFKTRTVIVKRVKQFRCKSTTATPCLRSGEDWDRPSSFSCYADASSRC